MDLSRRKFLGVIGLGAAATIIVPQSVKAVTTSLAVPNPTLFVPPITGWGLGEAGVEGDWIPDEDRLGLVKRPFRLGIEQTHLRATLYNPDVDLKVGDTVLVKRLGIEEKVWISSVEWDFRPDDGVTVNIEGFGGTDVVPSRTVRPDKVVLDRMFDPFSVGSRKYASYRP